MKLSIQDRRSLFSKIKEEKNLSWDKLYPLFSTTRSSFFNYMAGRNLIPLEIFQRLNKVAKLNIKNLKTLEKERFKEKDIIFPQMSYQLSEILGILNGDGHMNDTNYEVCIVGSILERDYLNYMKKLFEEVFSSKFTIEEKDNYFKLKIYSKKLVLYLNSEYGVPLGNKIGNLKIPSQVLKEKEWMLFYIKGIFDTDGCFHIRRKKDPMISVTSADQRYLSAIRVLLENIGFTVSKGDRRIFLYGAENVNRFFKMVKPANSKHLKKYLEWYSDTRG